MALNLLNLIGQAVAPQVAQDPNEIVVTGSPGPRYDPRMDPEAPNIGDPPSRPEVTPRYILNDDRMQPTEQEMRELLPRKGMFGTKGTLRDILGTVGDAFLVQAGKDRVYAPQRQMEREADALFGFTQDPMQAFERLATQNPAAAQKAFDDYQTQQYRQGTLDSQQATRENLMNDRNYTNITQAQTQLQRILANGANAEQRQRLAAYYGPLLAARSGVTPEELGLIPGMSDEDLLAFARGDMTVNQNELLDRRDTQLGISQQNADSARINATRPRATPRPRADTELEYYRQISNTPINKRTPEEQAFMKKYISGSRGSRIGAAPPPPPSGKSASRFRIVN